MSDAARRLLAIHKLGDFARWAEAHGYRKEETKGEYEVLRLRNVSQVVATRPERQPPLLYFRVEKDTEHLTCQAGSATSLVNRWIRESEPQRPIKGPRFKPEGTKPAPPPAPPRKRNE